MFRKINRNTRHPPILIKIDKRSTRLVILTCSSIREGVKTPIRFSKYAHLINDMKPPICKTRTRC